MNINRATRQYEIWLGEHLTLVPDDLTDKHTKMADAVFPFLRATFYRWAQEWPRVCAALAKAPAVLAVGDLHVENFGTWRDSEGRLIWGINDFDEAERLPYTNDLVRLATSVRLAIAAGHLSVKARDACNVILAGYTAGLQAGGRPFVLAEQHEQLRAEATSSLSDPVRFWNQLERLPTVNKAIPASASTALERSLPESGLRYRVAHRVAGLGSLGRQRWVALAEWHGGSIAREVKALAPSAWVWANQHDGSKSCLPGDRGPGGPCARPHSAHRQTLARAAARARLLAHRALGPAQRPRRDWAAARDGPGDREHPPGQHRWNQGDPARPGAAAGGLAAHGGRGHGARGHRGLGDVETRSRELNR